MLCHQFCGRPQFDMPIQPHTFPSLRREDEGDWRPALLIIGAGMSWGLVPSPDELCRTKRNSAEDKLGLASNMPEESTDLYRWAEDINVALIAAGDPVPKLKLAASLDIPQEHYWGATVRSKEATPRHRVIARFAREGLWE